MIPLAIGVGVVLLLLILIVPLAVKIVREYQRLMVFRLGRAIGAKGPGLVLLIPFVDKGVWVDLRELYLEIPHQAAITEDNATISIDFIVFYRVVDARMSVIEVRQLRRRGAEHRRARRCASVVGDMSLDDVLAKREAMNEILRDKLDEVTERWGVKVTNVEIREIIPPPQVQDAMTRQMSAERTRRAVVTEAEGPSRPRSPWPKGNKQSAILNAEGDRQAAILRAEGFSLALTRIFESARARRFEDDEPAVPGDAQADRSVALDEVRDPDGVHEPALGDHGLRRADVRQRQGRRVAARPAEPAASPRCRAG